VNSIPGLEPLELTRGCHVDILDEPVEQAQREKDGDEDGRGVADDDDSAGDVQAHAKHAGKGHGDGPVDVVDVLGEAIDDPS